VGSPQPATTPDERAWLVVLAVLHALARFVGRPDDWDAVELVARAWDQVPHLTGVEEQR
jgi:hypothetical protein